MIKCAFPVLAVAALAGSAMASSFPGNPADMYLTSDAANEVYQYERTSPWSYVPGAYAGVAKPQVFSNTSQVGGIGMYLGAVAGPSQNFFFGGFSGLTQVDSASGAFVSTVAGGLRLGPAKAPNGNLVVGGPSGVEEFNSTSGAFVRTVSSDGNGYNLHCFDGDRMYVSNWAGGFGFSIKQRSFTTGFSIGADIAVPFEPQEIAIGPDGSLYASNLYQASVAQPTGVYRYNAGTSSWALFADGDINTGTGPHGFSWDPITLDLYLAFQTGEIERYNGLTGVYLNQIDIVATKLTDILFKEVVPAPGAAGLLAMGGLMAARRRRRS